MKTIVGSCNLPERFEYSKKYLKSRPNIWMFARTILGCFHHPRMWILNTRMTLYNMVLAQLTSSFSWPLKCLNITSSIEMFPSRSFQGHPNSPETERSTPANEAAMACAESVVEGSAKIGRSTHSLGAKWLVEPKWPVVVTRNVLTIPWMSSN